MATPPQITPEQRAAALAKSAEARKARAVLKDQLKHGHTNLKRVLAEADANETISKMKVVELITAMPKIGRNTALNIMNELGIDKSRRVRGLGTRQRDALLKHFDYT